MANAQEAYAAAVAVVNAKEAWDVAAKKGDQTAMAYWHAQAETARDDLEEAGYGAAAKSLFGANTAGFQAASANLTLFAQQLGVTTQQAKDSAVASLGSDTGASAGLQAQLLEDVAGAQANLASTASGGLLGNLFGIPQAPAVSTSGGIGGTISSVFQLAAKFLPTVLLIAGLSVLARIFQLRVKANLGGRG